VIGQMARYGLVGLAQLGLEWLSFVALTLLAVPVSPANVLARVAGASLGYWMNGRFTFSSDGATLGRRALFRFCVSWGVMTILGTVAVTWLEHAGGLRAAWMGKPLVDIALAGGGFLASKFWIYRPDCPNGQS
jgi:putative flippase GtrA